MGQKKTAIDRRIAASKGCPPCRVCVCGCECVYVVQRAKNAVKDRGFCLYSTHHGSHRTPRYYSEKGAYITGVGQEGGLGKTCCVGIVWPKEIKIAINATFTRITRSEHCQ